MCVCIGAYVFALAVYFTVTIPTLRAVVDPLAEDTLWVRGEALRVLSAGNIIIALCLGAILVMQVRSFPCFLAFLLFGCNPQTCNVCVCVPMLTV